MGRSIRSIFGQRFHTAWTDNRHSADAPINSSRNDVNRQLESSRSLRDKGEHEQPRGRPLYFWHPELAERATDGLQVSCYVG